ncbi:hypothetical protein BKA62DRAFT_773348 [Auriculariales sp. MPI-PUGE-AT-0066]|nr:hypothetical protein BKA62DRAFT_773348 [Auriculariales sp. MPI-PUGE-AT-0066]
MPTRPTSLPMPPLVAPQPQPTFLGTPFATSSTINPFEYPNNLPSPQPISNAAAVAMGMISATPSPPGSSGQISPGFPLRKSPGTSHSPLARRVGQTSPPPIPPALVAKAQALSQR